MGLGLRVGVGFQNWSASLADGCSADLLAGRVNTGAEGSCRARIRTLLLLLLLPKSPPPNPATDCILPPDATSLLA